MTMRRKAHTQAMKDLTVIVCHQVARAPFEHAMPEFAEAEKRLALLTPDELQEVVTACIELFGPIVAALSAASSPDGVAPPSLADAMAGFLSFVPT